jgi:glutathione S-transferase
VSPSEKDYAPYLNWLHHADSTLTFPQTVVLRYTLQEKGRADAAAEDYAKWFIARLRLLDNTLKENPQREYLVGDRFTIADICVSYALLLGKSLTVQGSTLASHYQPQTTAYLERMIARDSFTRAQKKQKESLKEFKEQVAQQSP